jgi:hypothetical protein
MNFYYTLFIPIVLSLPFVLNNELKATIVARTTLNKDNQKIHLFSDNHIPQPGVDEHQLQTFMTLLKERKNQGEPLYLYVEEPHRLYQENGSARIQATPSLCCVHKNKRVTSCIGHEINREHCDYIQYENIEIRQKALAAYYIFDPERNPHVINPDLRNIVDGKEIPLYTITFADLFKAHQELVTLLKKCSLGSALKEYQEIARTIIRISTEDLKNFKSELKRLGIQPQDSMLLKAQELATEFQEKKPHRMQTTSPFCCCFYPAQQQLLYEEQDYRSMINNMLHQIFNPLLNLFILYKIISLPDTSTIVVISGHLHIHGLQYYLNKLSYSKQESYGQHEYQQYKNKQEAGEQLMPPPLHDSYCNIFLSF